MKNNEPAFPTTEIVISSVGTEHTQYIPGLTKREYFAAMAMQGILSTRKDGLRFSDIENLSEDAVLFADALLNGLNKEK